MVDSKTASSRGRPSPPSSASMRAAASPPPPSRDPPIVLVPGFLGSEHHWCAARLRAEYPHAQFVATEPGPLSSHHDRACEIFYTLKGGIVDYGEAHSKQCDHERFGRHERVAALPEWGARHPIDLVGHSIGGVTARVLQQLLADRFFPGHDTDASWIRSLTTLSSPHNGDPVVYSLGAVPHLPPSPSPQQRACGCYHQQQQYHHHHHHHSPPPSSPPHPHLAGGRVRLFSTGYFLTVAAHLASWLDSSLLSSMVDLRLDHWRLSRRRHGARALWSLLRAVAWRGSLGQSADNAAYEVRPTAAAALNLRTPPHAQTVYLSFVGSPRKVASSFSRVVAELLAGSLLGALFLLVRECVVGLFSIALRFGGGSRRAAVRTQRFSNHGRLAPRFTPLTQRLTQWRRPALLHSTHCSLVPLFAPSCVDTGVHLPRPPPRRMGRPRRAHLARRPVLPHWPPFGTPQPKVAAVAALRE